MRSRACSTRVATTRSRPRPRFRGTSHRVAFPIAIVAGIVLVVCAHDARAAISVAIYGALLAGMFGTSATLHRADWRPRMFGWLRRADHAMIFAFIAGTYTPLCVVGIGGSAGTRLLALAWTGGGLGILRAMLWPHAPRAITAGLFVLVGWVALVYLPEMHAALDPRSFAFMIAGGVAYTIGAVIYLVRWPDPIPAMFGYHEVFHVFVIAGCACHFVAIAHVI